MLAKNRYWERHPCLAYLPAHMALNWQTQTLLMQTSLLILPHFIYDYPLPNCFKTLNENLHSDDKTLIIDKAWIWFENFKIHVKHRQTEP